MVFILYFVRILPQKNGSKIPGNGQISTKMHGISFAVGAPPQTPLWGAHIAPRPLRYQGREGKGKGEGPAVALEPRGPEEAWSGPDDTIMHNNIKGSSETTFQQ